jgi:hypothetical protein
VKHTFVNGSVAVLASVALIGLAARSSVAQTPTARVVNAANAFLATLTEQQRQRVMFAYDDEGQRVRWSNFPIGMVPRAGISMGEMTAAQRTATITLLSAVLSLRGFEKIQQIMEADEVLKATEGTGRGGPNGKGGPPGGFEGKGPPPDGKGKDFKGKDGKGKGPGGGGNFGKDNYFVSILGTPSERNPWMLHFGGHHLALNVTIVGARGILTPTLTGAQPALYTLEGKTVRPLGQESDKAVALLNALNEDQKKQAVLSFRVADLVLGPGQDGKTIQPEGLKASSMNERQRAMLLDLISEWANIVNESSAVPRLTELKAEINDTWFAWSGPTNVTPGTNIASYYRIQGPHLVIEYAPQGMGGDPSNHIHTMYRDPTNDYGRKRGSK